MSSHLVGPICCEAGCQRPVWKDNRCSLCWYGHGGKPASEPEPFDLKTEFLVALFQQQLDGWPEYDLYEMWGVTS